MRFYEVTFFCSRKLNQGTSPLVTVSFDKDAEHYSITARINESGKHHIHPAVTFHMDENDWINFKNSVLACDRQLTEKILGRQHYE